MTMAAIATNFRYNNFSEKVILLYMRQTPFHYHLSLLWLQFFPLPIKNEQLLPKLYAIQLTGLKYLTCFLL